MDLVQPFGCQVADFGSHSARWSCACTEFVRPGCGSFWATSSTRDREGGGRVDPPWPGVALDPTVRRFSCHDLPEASGSRWHAPLRCRCLSMGGVWGGNVPSGVCRMALIRGLTL
ncbi:hypothetical protein BN12_280017 [Nostocoides japonicum T1-X7]|uniref:Uncharacterized protein n=1 Tax=Nostocoides japonicum T1-X7 TaxID=1194083 RepID=A0A077LXE5_9MICO|nr:hypothetical protein BN12_280017 [Tetrasphaera japonica T1-X7]